jgi:hypothetical protein
MLRPIAFTHGTIVASSLLQFGLSKLFFLCYVWFDRVEEDLIR